VQLGPVISVQEIAVVGHEDHHLARGGDLEEVVPDQRVPIAGLTAVVERGTAGQSTFDEITVRDVRQVEQANAGVGQRAPKIGAVGDFRFEVKFIAPLLAPGRRQLHRLDGREGDGFDWFDALIGALIASGLTLMTLVAARTVERHRRATAESRA
jgi:hypothetical protein